MTLHLSIQMFFNMLMTVPSFFPTIQLLIYRYPDRKNITKDMNAHDLKINVTKTEIMLFKEKESVELEFLKERLNSVPKAKFLGIIITPDVKFDHHIENNIIPNIRKHFSFFSYISKFLDRHHKQFIFRAFIFPFILYATPFLLNTSNIKIKSSPLHSIAL